jgi:shikimate dehydrogenase
MKKACVIGWPISHSRSPLIHNHWIAQHHLDAVYERVPVSPENLESFLRSLADNGYTGCNVTLPHKEQAFRIADHIDQTATRIGSINTVWLQDGKLHATSTDGVGFCTNVEQTVPGFSFRDTRVTMIGAGGSSRPIINEMLNRGAAEITLANRTLSRAQDVQKIFGAKVRAIALENVDTALPRTDLLINTTSIGLGSDTEFPADINLLPVHAIVADIVYVPLETSLLERAKARGLRTVGGLGMLLHQAVPGFEKWFGVRPQVTPELFALVAADITGKA